MGSFIVVICLAITGLFLGYFLALSAKQFHVEKDPKLEAIEAALPGANCGACGKPGCAGLAEAIFKGEAAVDGCPPGGADSAAKIAKIMGVEADSKKVKLIANIRCKGLSKEIAKEKFHYMGIESCVMANKTSGGWKQCGYGCLLLGDCVRACQFDALLMTEEGFPYVDIHKCTACGLCVEACPRDIIEMIPIKKRAYTVDCVSKDKGAITRKACTVGCIGCGLCKKACNFDAIEIENGLAVIDQDKCKFCGKCIVVCPQKTIELTMNDSGTKKVVVKNADSQDKSCGTCPTCTGH